LAEVILRCTDSETPKKKKKITLLPKLFVRGNDETKETASHLVSVAVRLHAPENILGYFGKLSGDMSQFKATK
jgi:hypothetical protein